MRLRGATPADSTATGAILGEFVTGTSWMPKLHSGAENEAFCAQMIEKGWMTIAEEAGIITGFLALNGDFIHALYVAEAARGHGIGAQLLALAQRQQAQLNLWTFQANRRAQRFYRRYGFTEVERTDGRSNDEGLPDIRFHWQRAA